MRLPKRVMPIVEKLRKYVERPGDLPIAHHYRDSYAQGFDANRTWPRWVRGGVACCPMGMLPGADPCPGDATSIPGDYKDCDVEEFAEWWDDLTIDEACAAVELIWPR